MNMCFLKIKITLLSIIGMLLFAGSENAVAQQKKLSAEYLRRAETMYRDIWQRYRVPAYQGLFSEHFPSNGNDTLSYFQGDKVKEKEVSFLWPFSGVFSATNVLVKAPSVKKKYLPYLDSLSVGMESYRDTTRPIIGYQAYPSRFETVDRYYDDNGLVGIEYAEAYLNTKNPVYLSRAKTVFKFILSGWTDQLGGGVYWLEGHRDQKPACSNGMAMLVALKLYKATKDTTYLNWGTRFYNWMKGNLGDPNGVYWNDKKTADGSVNKVYYSYNTGSMLEASVLLYQFTNDKKYLNEAKFIAKGAWKHFSNQPHDPNLNIQVDLPWFFTVLFKGYETLYRVDGNYTYVAAISKDLNYAWKNSRDKYGFITSNWTCDPTLLTKSKWLLDEACIAELYARLSILEAERHH